MYVAALLTFCVSSFFSCLRMSVRLMSFSMASTCLLRCLRYMPQALQYASNSSPNLWLTVLLCISDLLGEQQEKSGEMRCDKHKDKGWAFSFLERQRERKVDNYEKRAMNGWWLTWDARKRNVLFFDWSEPFSGENGPGDCRDTAHILIPRTGGERERKDLMERKKRRRRQEAQMSDSRLYDVSPPQSPWQSKT